MKQPFAEVFQNRVFFKSRNIPRKTPMLESLFDKVAGLRDYNFIEKILQHKCFPVNIAKVFGIAFL